VFSTHRTFCFDIFLYTLCMSHEDENEIKELLRANLKLSHENNKMLRKMRRDSLIGFWIRILFFCLIAWGSYYTYQHYLGVYMDQVLDMYSSLQEDVDMFKTLPEKIKL